MGRRVAWGALGALGAVLGGSAALAGGMPGGIGLNETAIGKVLADGRGMTLYVFDKDAGGESACYDKCAELWPPLAAPAGFAGEGAFAVAARKDGKAQLVYKGKPLYTWHKDAAPGETSGDGFRDVWHVARP